jgi:hypothetical protein
VWRAAAAEQLELWSKRGGCGGADPHPLDGVEHDCPRVAALVAPHQLGAHPLGPQLELLGGRGPEGVAGGHDHRPALGHLLVADLADGGGLAHAVDPDEQPDVGLAGLDAQRAVGDRQALLEVGLEGVDQLLGRGDALGLDLGPQLVEEGGGGGDADVGPDQGLLQLLPGLLVDLGAGPHRAEVAGQQAPGLAQAVAEAGLGRRRRRLAGLGGLDRLGLGAGQHGLGLGHHLGRLAGQLLLGGDRRALGLGRLLGGAGGGRRRRRQRRGQRRLELGVAPARSGRDEGGDEATDHQHGDEAEDDLHGAQGTGRSKPPGWPSYVRNGRTVRLWRPPSR